MTREEAKKIIFYQWQDFLEHNLDYAGVSDAYKIAIKALEEELVLDKIRAEIQENINYNKKMNYQGIVAGLLLALDIIDKYKTESEGTE